MVTRRTFLSAGALLSAPCIQRGRFSLFARNATEHSTRAIDLVRRSTVIDMLGLLTLNYRLQQKWADEPDSFRPADFERLKQSGITVFHPAVGYVEGDVYRSSFEDIRRWNIFLVKHSDKFLRIEKHADLAAAKASGKIGIMIGQQNSAHFRTVSDVDRFYAMGQRVSQLTYMRNRLGGGSTEVKDIGLTPYGAEIVERMNAIGMVVDVSHCGDRTTLDAVKASRRPVLVTHSNCRALVPRSARCKTDEAIRKMAEKGGVLGVTMVRPFVCSSGQATIEHVLDHMDHVIRVAGVEHVGIGTDVDLDGREPGRTVRRSDLDGMQYVRKIYDLTEGLIRRKYSDADIELMLGGNFHRALQASLGA